MENKNLVKRILMSLFGVIVCAISVGIFKSAALGVDPFQSFMAGLDALVPIKFGTLYVIANTVLFIFMLIFDRHYIGIATFINLFLLGYITQFTYEFLQTVIVEPALWLRIVCLVVGVVIICFGSAFYMTADLGVSTYDAVALIIVNTWKRGKFQYVRIITDLVCVMLGVALFLISGGAAKDIITIAGVGTIITAFFMGPLIEFFNVHCARPILNKQGGRSPLEPQYFNAEGRILREKGLKSPTADKYFGQSKESIGIDYFEIMKIFSTSVLKEDFSEIEEYGLIQICDLSFSKAYSSLNSISKKKFKLKLRTSYSLFEYFIDYGYLNISNSWSYWNNNHDKFSCIYNTPKRYKVIQDIKNIYFPMFRIIEEYIKEMKKKLVEYTKELI